VSTPIRQDTCPICGGPNACGLAAGASTCWCFETRIPAEAIARVPAEALDRSCICQACAAAGVSSPTAVPADVEQP
jgi:hypothetical protein